MNSGNNTDRCHEASVASYPTDRNHLEPVDNFDFRIENENHSRLLRAEGSSLEPGNRLFAYVNFQGGSEDAAERRELMETEISQTSRKVRNHQLPSSFHDRRRLSQSNVFGKMGKFDEEVANIQVTRTNMTNSIESVVSSEKPTILQAKHNAKLGLVHFSSN